MLAQNTALTCHELHSPIHLNYSWYIIVSYTNALDVHTGLCIAALTCNLPLSSLSFLIFTYIFSSRLSLTRSRGSSTAATLVYQKYTLHCKNRFTCITVTVHHVLGPISKRKFVDSGKLPWASNYYLIFEDREADLI